MFSASLKIRCRLRSASQIKSFKGVWKTFFKNSETSKNKYDGLLSSLLSKIVVLQMNCTVLSLHLQNNLMFANILADYFLITDACFMWSQKEKKNDFYENWFLWELIFYLFFFFEIHGFWDYIYILDLKQQFQKNWLCKTQMTLEWSWRNNIWENSCSQMFFKTDNLKNSAIITRKHLCLSLL